MKQLLRSWTIGRATQAGLVAGLAALALWPAYALFQEPLRLPFAASLAMLGFCGLSILVITAVDISRHSRRSRHIRTIRILDVILGLAMTIPGLLTLPELLPEFS